MGWEDFDWMHLMAACERGNEPSGSIKAVNFLSS
jgi:hypothetical protein